MLPKLITKKLLLACLFITCCAQSIIYAHTIKHMVDHIFQRQQPNVAPEVLDKSCLVATTAMSLKHLIKHKKINYRMPTYAQLCKELQTDSQGGTFIHSITEFLDQDNWDYKIITDHIPELIDCLYDGPICALIKNSSSNDLSHAVLLTEKNTSGFTFLDPWYPKSSPQHKQFMSFNEFSKNWFPKIAIQILY